MATGLDGGESILWDAAHGEWEYTFAEEGYSASRFE